VPSNVTENVARSIEGSIGTAYAFSPFVDAHRISSLWEDASMIRADDETSAGLRKNG
jgi:hypothetical protein